MGFIVDPFVSWMNRGIEARCCDCGTRIIKRSPIHKRCEKCAKIQLRENVRKSLMKQKMRKEKAGDRRIGE